ncbi:hypothetical protein, partial [Actinomycetospora sp. NBRC 106375]|uniref:hypothetical protein n=1 Tax=Actinomycetospora sp. NBRC 106375 TaxID=3032207 RepID=UPI002554D5A1
SPRLDLGHTDIVAHRPDKISSDRPDQADTPNKPPINQAVVLARFGAEVMPLMRQAGLRS